MSMRKLFVLVILLLLGGCTCQEQYLRKDKIYILENGRKIIRYKGTREYFYIVPNENDVQILNEY